MKLVEHDTLQVVVDFLGEATERSLKEMIDAGITVLAGTAPAESLTWMPMGWVSAEMAPEDTVGIKWVRAMDIPGQSFECMMELLVFVGRTDKCRTNPTLAMLMQVRELANSLVKEEPTAEDDETKQD